MMSKVEVEYDNLIMLDEADFLRSSHQSTVDAADLREAGYAQEQNALLHESHALARKFAHNKEPKCGTAVFDSLISDFANNRWHYYYATFQTIVSKWLPIKNQ